MLKFLVKGQKIEVLEREVIASEQISFVTIKFLFDNPWKQLHKVVQFTQCNETYNRVLGVDGLSCLLPVELHPGTVKVSIFGYKADITGALRATTVPIILHIRPSGFVGDGTDAIPPTLDLYAQLLQELENKASSLQNGKDGIDGLSAFEIAVKNGFTGTISDWLASLKGTDGVDGKDGVNGIDGKDGADGKDGKTPDLSDYAKISYVDDKILQINDRMTYEEQMLEQRLFPLEAQMHFHENMGFLNLITEERMENWDKSVDLSDYVTTESVDLKIQQLNALITDYYQQNASRIEVLEQGFEQLRDSTKYELQVQNEKFLNLETQISLLWSAIEGGSESVTLFHSGVDAISKYAPNMALILHEGYHLMTDFADTYSHFCCAENDYAISYNVTDFGWDVQVVTICLTELSLIQHSQIAMCYQSGSTENGKLYLVAKPVQTIDIPLGLYIYNQIQASNMVSLPFQWLYSENDITTLTKCDGITAGQYYVAWVGRSNNSHPKIKSVQVWS